MSIDKRLLDLGIELQELPKAAAVYTPYVISNNTLYISGQTPKEGTSLVYKGKLGSDFDVEDGYKAARLCGVRCLSVLKAALGDLDRVKRIIKLTGYVNSQSDFEKQSKVIDGVSELMQDVFGDKGVHARVAVGVNSLPGNAAVEVEMVVEID